jgi:hypothetical protein
MENNMRSAEEEISPSANVPPVSEDRISDLGVESNSTDASKTPTLLDVDLASAPNAELELSRYREHITSYYRIRSYRQRRGGTSWRHIFSRPASRTEWPISPTPFRKSWTTAIIENCTYLLMGICAAMFLGKFQTLHFCA